MGYDYEKYGFPVSQLRNHLGAINYLDELDIYLEAKLARHSIAGPFLSPPFSRRMAISPLNSVPKKDSAEQPLNTSVNIGNDKSLHEGVEFALQYPTVDHIASLIARKASGCLIYKCDLRKAY